MGRHVSENFEGRIDFIYNLGVTLVFPRHTRPGYTGETEVEDGRGGGNETCNRSWEKFKWSVKR